MSRVVAFWGKAAPVAKQVSSRSHCTYAPDGQSFSFSWDSIYGQQIVLEKLRLQVIKESQELTRSLTELFPYIDFSTFALSKIVDDTESSLSLFDRPENRAYFQPFIDLILAHLGHDGTSNPDVEPTTPVFDSKGKLKKKPAREWLEGPQDVLRKALAHFYRTVGVPPRPWQTSDLLYRDLAGYSRNLRLLHNGVSYISNPRAKQRDKLMYDAFWALPSHLSIVFIFLLGVVRPIEILLMNKLKVPTDEHHHYIFVDTKKKPQHASSIFNTSTINNILIHNTTPELAYESRAYRHIMQSIIDHHFAHLHIDTVSTLIADAGNGMAQHTPETHANNYARDKASQATGIPLSERNKQFAISGAFHSWFGFTPEQSSNWSTMVNYRPSEDVNLHRRLALDTARRLVIENYGLPVGTKESCADRVRDLMNIRPFLRPASNGDDGSFQLGDDVLTQVTGCIVYGIAKPSALSYPPLGGFSPQDVAMAIVVVS